MLRWRAAVVVAWALLGGAFFGWGTEYATLFDDPPADPSVGRAMAKAVLFGASMLVYGLMRESARRDRSGFCPRGG